MVIVTVSLTVGYIYRELKKRKIMNTAVKEREVMFEEYNRHFNEKWRRANKIKKLRTKKRILEMLKLKSKR
jgi:ABC-type sulfate transport system substrate-binding protein